MEIMDVIKELTEDELLELAHVIYTMGTVAITYLTPEQAKRKLKLRIREWLEVDNG